MLINARPQTPGVGVAYRDYTWSTFARHDNCTRSTFAAALSFAMAPCLKKNHKILDEPGPSTKDTHASPIAGKTPTTNIHVAELATAVDGGNGSKYIDGTPSKGLLVIPFPPPWSTSTIDTLYTVAIVKICIRCYD